MKNKSQRLKCVFGHHKLKAKAEVRAIGVWDYGWFITVNCDCCGIRIAHTNEGTFLGLIESAAKWVVKYIDENNRIPTEIKFYGSDNVKH